MADASARHLRLRVPRRGCRSEHRLSECAATVGTGRLGHGREIGRSLLHRLRSRLRFLPHPLGLRLRSSFGFGLRRLLPRRLRRLGFDFRRSHRFLGGGGRFSSDYFLRFGSFHAFDRSDFAFGRQRNQFPDQRRCLATIIAGLEREGGALAILLLEVIAQTLRHGRYMETDRRAVLPKEAAEALRIEVLQPADFGHDRIRRSVVRFDLHPPFERCHQRTLRSFDDDRAYRHSPTRLDARLAADLARQMCHRPGEGIAAMDATEPLFQVVEGNGAEKHRFLYRLDRDQAGDGVFVLTLPVGGQVVDAHFCALDQFGMPSAAIGDVNEHVRVLGDDDAEALLLKEELHDADDVHVGIGHGIAFPCAAGMADFCGEIKLLSCGI